jgi:hypothetical protein
MDYTILSITREITLIQKGIVVESNWEWYAKDPLYGLDSINSVVSDKKY